MMGVPKGWRAYATKASGLTDAAEKSLKDDYEFIVKLAETEDVLFMVYSGGKSGRKSLRQ